MHSTVYSEFERLISELKPRGRILEVGSVPSPNALLAISSIAQEERIGLNMAGESSFRGFKIVEGNGNNMNMFADDSFDCVLSNATLEHDRFFWLTCSEIRRVLRPGGLAIIGVPGFTKETSVQRLKVANPWITDDWRDWTASSLILRYHGHPHDYYRFSENAMREAIFAGFRDVAVKAIMVPPRIIGYGYKQ